MAERLGRTSVSFSTCVLVPLAAVGTATLAYYLQKVAAKTVRKVLEVTDPIRPRTEEVSALLRPQLSLDRIEAHIQERDDVVQGAERCIVWADRNAKTKTSLCVVYLHGWSACRQECSPVPELIANALNANLFCSRLPGHGRRHPRGILGGGGPSGEALLEEATPRRLFLCAVDSIRIGLSLGERVVLVGMSTGGALFTWLASLDSVQPSVAALVLISPAYALAHPLYPILKHTLAALRLLPNRVRSKLLDLILGPTKTAAKLSEIHHRYTTLTYPTSALLHLLDVLWEIEMVQMSAIEVPTLVIGNPEDHVVNFRVTATNAFLQLGDAPRKMLYCISTTEHAHTIASKISSPKSFQEIAQIIIGFLQDSLSSPTQPTASLCRAASVPIGLGAYGRSFPSFSDLTRPFEA